MGAASLHLDVIAATRCPTFPSPLPLIRSDFFAQLDCLKAGLDARRRA